MDAGRNLTCGHFYCGLKVGKCVVLCTLVIHSHHERYASSEEQDGTLRH